MLGGSSEELAGSYLAVGQSAITAIERGLAAFGRSFDDVESALDFGCGYGRVLRVLVEHVPPQRITASDLDAEAVSFCAEAFGVNACVSRARLDRIDLGTFDLIWAGSVITHLTRESSDRLLDLFARSLRPGGVALMSFHGERALHFLGIEAYYGHEAFGRRDEIPRELDADGFSFCRYEAWPLDGEYGVTFHSLEFLRERVQATWGDRLDGFHHLPAGWNGHHDVLALHRAAQKGEEPAAPVAPEPRAPLAMPLAGAQGARRVEIPFESTVRIEHRVGAPARFELCPTRSDLEVCCHLQHDEVLYPAPLEDWGGHRVMTFTPESPGRYRLRFQWRRAGERGAGSIVVSVGGGRKSWHSPARVQTTEGTTLWAPSEWEEEVFSGRPGRLARAVARLLSSVSERLRSRTAPARVASPEGPALAELSRLVGPESVVYDVGSNLGVYAISLAKLAAGGQVICFEVNPVCVHYLRANLALSGIGNATIVPVAVLDHAGSEDFCLQYGNSTVGVSSSSLFFDQKVGHSIRVEAARLDDLVERLALPLPDVVKVDVEGSEGAVLRGMRGLLERQAPKLALELHGEHAIVEAGAVLEPRGYTYTHAGTARSFASSSEILAALGDGVVRVVAQREEGASS